MATGNEPSFLSPGFARDGVVDRTYDGGMLVLALRQPFAAGGVRACFLHPDFPDRCVKVMRVNPEVEATLLRAGIKLRVNPGLRTDDNLREYRVYQEFQQEGNQAIWRHFPRCHGLVDTDLGQGLVTDYLAGHGGRPAPTLLHRIRTRTYDAQCLAAVREFQRFLVQHEVRTGDMNLSNLVLWSPEATAPERLYLIDGLGNAPSVLCWRWFRPLRLVQLRRKIKRMDASLHRNLARHRPHPVCEPPSRVEW